MDAFGIVATISGLGILGLIFGIILAIAAQKFHVEVDPRIEKVSSALAGANCGGCGYAGCSGYAAAIVLKGAPVDKCAPGGQEAAKKIADIMGQALKETERQVAIVSCQGTPAVAKERFFYDGIADCRAAMLVNAGHKGCTFGCLGFGTCAKACPFGAIYMSSNRLPVIAEDNCKGCGVCVEACPRGIIRLAPYSKYVYVLCKNTDKGAATKKVCSSGCIKCKKCEKVCKFGAIKVETNLAVIDYSKCTNCGKCVNECPQNVIVNLRKFRKERKNSEATKPEPEKEEVAA